jgi:ABC-type lipoprotein export system ATPase subunit
VTAPIDVREAFRIHRSGAASAVALQGLSLRVEVGEIVVVLGPSGSGKTTLLRALAGFQPLSAGAAHVLGSDLGSLPPRRLARFRAENLGILDQHYARALSPDLSSLQTVALGLELLGEARSVARMEAASLLERVGLGDRLDARPSLLSGGEQQRVAVCAALAHRPRLLLADEPAGELDDANAQLVYALIGELVRERNASALVVSHDEAAAEIADRLVYVRDGRVVEEARPGGRRELVVTDPGWIRLPDPLLAALNQPRRLRVERRGAELAITSAGGGSSAGRPSPPPLATPHTCPRRVVAELRGIVKRFEAAPQPVLDRVTHRFESGTFTAIVGRSGSGKTTLLHLLAGLDLPTEGEVLVAGVETGSISRSAVAALRREHIALVTQEPGLVPHLTARENVELGLHVRGLAGGARDRAVTALGEVGLGHRVDHRADRLSAGERQRVAIGRAVAAHPTLLLADEPSAHLDQENAHAVARLLARLAHETGVAVICATHDPALIEEADVVSAPTAAPVSGSREPARSV